MLFSIPAKGVVMDQNEMRAKRQHVRTFFLRIIRSGDMARLQKYAKVMMIHYGDDECISRAIADELLTALTE